jgi:hypothetical protein
MHSQRLSTISASMMENQHQQQQQQQQQHEHEQHYPAMEDETITESESMYDVLRSTSSLLYSSGSSSSLPSKTAPILTFVLCVSVLLLLHIQSIAATPTTSPSSSSSSTTSSSSSSSRKALLTIFDFAPFSYRAEIAEYGSTMEPQIVYASTLMVPPKNYSSLCDLPPTIEQQLQLLLDNDDDSDNDDTTNNSTTIRASQPSSSSTEEMTSSSENSGGVGSGGPPIALLVSLGGCHPYIKAKAALTIQQTVAPDLRYIVFYNNNPNDPDTIMTLQKPSTTTIVPVVEEEGGHEENNTDDEYAIYACNDDDEEEGVIRMNDDHDYNSLGCVDIQEVQDSNLVFVSVSTGTGTAILGRMERLALASGTRPELLSVSENNNRWSLVSSIRFCDWIVNLSLYLLKRKKHDTAAWEHDS